MLDLSLAEVALACAISDVCEVAQFAGWLENTEFEVWQLLHDPRPEWGVAGQEELVAALEKVGAAAMEAGCWVTWPASAEQAQAVELGEWERMYRAWRAA